MKGTVSNHFAKAAMADAFRRVSHHSINKKVGKIEIVLSAQTLQTAVKIYYCNCTKYAHCPKCDWNYW